MIEQRIALVGHTAHVRVLGARYGSAQLQTLARAGTTQVVLHLDPENVAAVCCYALSGRRLDDLVLLDKRAPLSRTMRERVGPLMARKSVTRGPDEPPRR